VVTTGTKPTAAELHEAATVYAEWGYAVFPLIPRSKKPLTEHGCKEATTDLDQIDSWWSDGRPYNIGISTEGLFVLDVDTMNDGTANPFVPSLNGHAVDLDAAPCVVTRNNGRHYWFRQTDSQTFRNTQGKIATKVDTRANGGYAVAPPSYFEPRPGHEDDDGPAGQWQWLPGRDIEKPELLPTVPAWLVDRLATKPATTEKPRTAGDTLEKGSRNDTLFKMACRLRRSGFAQSAINSALLAENIASCNPPLDADEVEKIAASVMRYEPDDSITNDPAAGCVTPRALTDLGNGERFAARYGGHVRYVAAWDKWFLWNGRRWVPDETGEVMRLAKFTAKSIHGEAAIAEDEDRQKEITKFAFASQSRPRLEAMLALAKSEQPISIAYSSLDADPWLLNCENGTVCLRTGELRPHDPADLLTKSTGIEYAADAGDDAVLWAEFLHTIFAGDRELIRFVQRLLGVSLIGEQKEHLFPIAYGSGANGKSVLFGVVQDSLGEYAITAAPNLFTVKRGDSHPTELADLHGRRLAVLNETQDGAKLNEGLIKSITGGDRIKARRMREDFWEFAPSHTAYLVTNHRPVVSGTDFGIWRRLRLLPFTVTIPAERQDRDLPEKLRAEGPAILRWMVQGCLDWQREGLGDPAAVKVATEGYRAESDTLGRWLEECCLVHGSAQSKASSLLDSFNKWAQTLHENEESATWLGRKLAEKGFTKARTTQGVMYRGIGLLEADHA
jgi:putative DNA primase/helicase